MEPRSKQSGAGRAPDARKRRAPEHRRERTLQRSLRPLDPNAGSLPPGAVSAPAPTPLAGVGAVRGVVAVGGGEVRVPEVEYEDDARRGPFVPDVVLEGVVEDERGALDPGHARLGPDAERRAAGVGERDVGA